MLPSRPDINEFIDLTNQFATAKTEVANLEWEFEKAKAHNIKIAMDNKAKTRAIDYVKVIGNNDKDEKYLDGLMTRIIATKRDITVLYGKLEAWKADKDLYRTDSYHMVTGKFAPSGEDE